MQYASTGDGDEYAAGRRIFTDAPDPGTAGPGAPEDPGAPDAGRDPGTTGPVQIVTAGRDAFIGRDMTIIRND